VLLLVVRHFFQHELGFAALAAREAANLIVFFHFVCK
jgi:hypothetical protein